MSSIQTSSGVLVFVDLISISGYGAWLNPKGQCLKVNGPYHHDRVAKAVINHLFHSGQSIPDGFSTSSKLMQMGWIRIVLSESQAKLTADTRVPITRAQFEALEDWVYAEPERIVVKDGRQFMQNDSEAMSAAVEHIIDLKTTLQPLRTAEIIDGLFQEGSWTQS